MVDPVVHAIALVALLLATPALSALLLRWARCPGWPVVGGVIAGLVLGPNLLGGLKPDLHERLFIGGATERLALDDLNHELHRDQVVLRAAGADESVIRAQLEPYVPRVVRAEQVLAEARWNDQMPLRGLASIFVIVVLTAGGMMRIPRADRRQGLLTPMGVGLWSAALPGALAYLAMTAWWSHSASTAAITAAAVAIGPWVLTKIDRQAADDAEFGGAHMMQTAGRVATLIALAALAWGAGSRLGFPRVLWCAPLLAVVVGWWLPAMDHRSLRALMNVVFIPSLAAVVAVKINVIGHVRLWPLLVFIILSGDGRWIGALLGSILPGGRRVLRTMRLVLGSMACGPTQLAVAATAVHANLLPPEIPLGLVLGAVVIEVTTPLRRTMAHRIIETETEIEQLRDDK